MSTQVFFSDLFAIILDAYFEFLICCYYNIAFEIDPKALDVIAEPTSVNFTTSITVTESDRRLLSSIVIPLEY